MADEATGESPQASDQKDAALVTAQIAALIGGLDLASEFEAEGSPYSELDENGQVVTRHPPLKEA